MLANRPHHSVCFRDAASELASAVSTYLNEQLKCGGSALVLIRGNRVGVIEAALIERGLDVAQLRLCGQLVIVATEEVLPRLVRAGELDFDAFESICAQQVRRIVSVFGSVRAYDELVDVLEERGRHDLALRLEEQWSKLQRDVGFDRMSGYDEARFAFHARGSTTGGARHSDVFEVGQPSSRERSIAVDIRPFSPRIVEEHAGPLTAGRLLNVVLHDIGNVVATIRWSAADIRNTLPESSDAHEALNDILEAVDRCTSLSQDVLGLSRRHASGVARPLDETVGGLSRLLRRAASCKVQFAAILDCGLSVPVSQSELTQLLVNLVVNARQAVSAGGHIELRTYQRVGAAGFESGEPAAVIEVKDDGVGMRPEDIEVIFDEHHTTRAGSEGNGLGLCIVRSIVNKYDGRIEVESEPNQGSCFRVYLRATAQSS